MPPKPKPPLRHTPRPKPLEAREAAIKVEADHGLVIRAVRRRPALVVPLKPKQKKG